MAEVLGSGLPHADALRTWRDGRPSGARAARLQVVARDGLGAPGEHRNARRACWLPSCHRSTPRSPTPARALGLEPDAELAAPRRPLRRAGPSGQSRRAAGRARAADAAAARSSRTRFSSRCPAGRQRAPWRGSSRSDLDRLSGIEAIERYYRLGAGVEGALSRLHTGLFETEPRKSRRTRR